MSVVLGSAPVWATFTKVTDFEIFPSGGNAPSRISSGHFYQPVRSPDVIRHAADRQVGVGLAWSGQCG